MPAAKAKKATAFRAAKPVDSDVVKEGFDSGHQLMQGHPLLLARTVAVHNVLESFSMTPQDAEETLALLLHTPTRHDLLAVARAVTQCRHAIHGLTFLRVDDALGQAAY